MNNPRITNKDRGLIKAAIRRAFSRSDLHNEVRDATRVEYSDLNRPRVKKWSRCQKCREFTPTYLIDVDHIEPLIPVDKTFAEMSLDDVVDRIWCEKSNLQGICHVCHDKKSSLELELRRQHKKSKDITKKSLRNKKDNSNIKKDRKNNDRN